MTTSVGRSAPLRPRAARIHARPSFAYRFSRHRGGVIGAIVVLAFVAGGVLAPLIAPYDPLAADITRKLEPPSSTFWLGTDEIGRDILSRLLFGAGISLRVGLSVVLIGVAIGVPVGAITGYVGGGVDLLVQRLIDTVQAFPGILMLVLILALAGPSLELAAVGLGFLSAPAYARLMRGKVLQVREVLFVEAARATGCPGFTILRRHIVPNSISPVIVQSSLQAATALLLLSGVSFLGLGAQPPAPEWGSMLSQGRIYIRSAPHIVVFVGLAISLVVLGLNLVGDALRDALDPKTHLGRRT